MCPLSSFGLVMRYDSYLKETLGKRILQNDGFRHFKTLNLPVTAPFRLDCMLARNWAGEIW